MILYDGVHVSTDNRDIGELHDFAERIGLSEDRFHVKGSRFPHYDLLTTDERIRASVYGAEKVGTVRLSMACRNSKRKAV